MRPFPALDIFLTKSYQNCNNFINDCSQARDTIIEHQQKKRRRTLYPLAEITRPGLAPGLDERAFSRTDKMLCRSRKQL
jgi:hypothetical protein